MDEIEKFPGKFISVIGIFRLPSLNKALLRIGESCQC